MQEKLRGCLALARVDAQQMKSVDVVRFDPNGGPLDDYPDHALMVQNRGDTRFVHA